MDAREFDFSDEAPEPADSTHTWRKATYLKNAEVCEVCGTVRRIDRKNGPCRGSLVVKPRT